MTTTTRDILPAIKKEATPAIRAAESLRVTTETMPEATRLLSVLNRTNDALTESKELLTKPLNTALKEIRSRYKPLEADLAEAIDMVRGKMSQYQTQAKRESDAEAAKIAARVAPGRGNLSPETATKKIADITMPAKEVHSDEGVVKFKTVSKVEITPLTTLCNDAEAVEYLRAHLVELLAQGLLVWDEVAVRKNVLGARDDRHLRGVRYYQEQVPENIR